MELGDIWSAFTYAVGVPVKLPFTTSGDRKLNIHILLLTTRMIQKITVKRTIKDKDQSQSITEYEWKHTNHSLSL